MWRKPRKRRLKFSTWLSIALAGVGYSLFLRPRMLRWGASADEAHRGFPGDDLVRQPVVETTRAITIHAPAREVWPWLAQMGQGRGGFYSYDWLENLFRMDIHNADRIIPDLQDIKVGDLIPFWRGVGVRVKGLEPGCWLALAGSIVEGGRAEEAGGSWVFVVDEKGPRETRLIVRARIAGFAPMWLCLLFTRLLLEPSHFVMERGMMMGIKGRAEGGILSR